MDLRSSVTPRVLALLALSTLAACGGGSQPAATAPHVSARPSATADPTPLPSDSPTPAAATPDAVAATPAPLAAPVADLRTVTETSIAMRLSVPSQGIDLPMFAVGLTRSGAMDAPEGPPNSALWHQAFWYRGDVEPGQLGTAAIAGHLDDTLGRPAAFWNMRHVVTGNEIDILDQRTGSTIRFHVVETDTYDLRQLGTAAVLTRLFGADALAGRPAGTTPDTVARLSLITCTGTFVHGEYDHRYVVYAVRDAS